MLTLNPWHSLRMQTVSFSSPTTPLESSWINLLHKELFRLSTLKVSNLMSSNIVIQCQYL